VPDGPAASANLGVPAIRIVSIEWQRIQVIVRLHPMTGGPLDPQALRLMHASPLHRAMPPTHGSVDGDDVVLRFNVMQGPGQMPLSPGRWRLVVANPGHRSIPLEVADRGPLDPARDGARFSLSRGDYRVVPRVDPPGASFSLDVSLEPGAGAVAVARTLQLRLVEAAVRPFRTVRHMLFRLLFRTVRLVGRRNGRRILFTSDSRAELGGNLQIVHEAMVERGLDHEYELMTLFKPSVAVGRPFRDRLRLPWLLARADVVVIDDFQPVIYHLEPRDVRIVQLWHAVGAFKTVGYSRVGKQGAPDPFSRTHKNYTYAIVSSGYDVPCYAEAFGIPESSVVPTGIPRVDRFFDLARREAQRTAALAAFPAAQGRLTILLAPTFRGDGAKSATYDVDRLDYVALHALCVEKDAVCLIRMHPFVREPPAIPDAFQDRILDASSTAMDVNDLLFAVDLLITDYSSIVFEYSALGRPMLFYAYDLEEYLASRDFYEPYEEFVPGRIVRTFEELLDAIRREDYGLDKVARFAARHFAHLDGGSTDRVIELILSR
jgi:CDP-ribitol ribitolphosphotransferase